MQRVICYLNIVIVEATEGKPLVIVVMGVSGVGKSTVGRLLADTLGWDFYDADDFHPERNVVKMRSGLPLDDGDRMPWLRALRALIEECIERTHPAVLACSALKASYRTILHGGDKEVRFVYLAATPGLVQERLEARTGHFMNPDLLSSQIATLEVPRDACRVSAAGTPEEIVEEIRREVGV